MKNKYFSLYSALLALMLTSCTKILQDFKFDDKEPLIVIQAKFEPDSTVYVFVTRSLDMYDRKEIYKISGASVALVDVNSENKIALHSDSSGWYSLDPGVISEGMNYRLEVEAPGYQNAVASFLVPSLPEITGIDTIHETSMGPYEYEQYYVRFTINLRDNPLNEDYYMIYGRVLSPMYSYDNFGNMVDTVYSYSYVELNSKSPFIELTKNIYSGYSVISQNLMMYGHELYFSDRHFNGEDNVSIDVRYSPQLIYDPSYETLLELFITTIDRNYFDYVWVKMREQSAANNILSEPVTPYSNIDGGLGLVYGKSARKFTFVIKAYQDYNFY